MNTPKRADSRKIWYVDFPTSQYKENAKDLAKARGLRIIDSRFKGAYPNDMIEMSPPSLSSKSKGQVKKEAEAAKEQIVSSVAVAAQ